MYYSDIRESKSYFDLKVRDALTIYDSMNMIRKNEYKLEMCKENFSSFKAKKKRDMNF